MLRTRTFQVSSRTGRGGALLIARRAQRWTRRARWRTCSTRTIPPSASSPPRGHRRQRSPGRVAAGKWVRGGPRAIPSCPRQRREKTGQCSSASRAICDGLVVPLRPPAPTTAHRTPSLPAARAGRVPGQIRERQHHALCGARGYHGGRASWGYGQRPRSARCAWGAGHRVFLSLLTLRPPPCRLQGWSTCFMCLRRTARGCSGRARRWR